MSNLEMKVDAIINLLLCKDENERAFALANMRGLVGEANLNEKVDVERKIKDILLDIGVPDSLLGHTYLVRAIKLTVEKPGVIHEITSVLYPTIAQEFSTNHSRVERAIRHAIEVSMDRGNLDDIDKYFGNTVSPSRGKPTNGEFIARIANCVR